MQTLRDIVEAGPEPFIAWLKEQPEDREFNILRGAWWGNKPEHNSCPFAGYLATLFETGHVSFYDVTLGEDFSEDYETHDIEETWMTAYQNCWYAKARNLGSGSIPLTGDEVLNTLVEAELYHADPF